MSQNKRARPRVTILQRRLVSYRLTLFERLRAECDEAGIELRLVYGQPSANDATRNDSGSLPWADEVDSRWFSVNGIDLCWQPCPAEARDCDLVVLTQESKLLSNYPFLAQRGRSKGPGRRKVAYWGHGQNLQAENPGGLRERWKELLVTKVDWWFAYNPHTRELLLANGYPSSQITCLNNAIDNTAFADDLDSVDDALLAELRQQIDLLPGAPLALYCGALYADKRVDLMVDIADHLHHADPSFRLVVIGDGPVRPQLEARIHGKPWAHWLGVKQGIEKAGWFRLADVLLSPGAVGLHVLDAYVAGVPLFTTRDARHGPEIAYLEHERTGFILPDRPAAFAEEVQRLLKDPARYDSVVAAGRELAGTYTLDNMVANFLDGIQACLAS